jgi:VanZ family protein
MLHGVGYFVLACAFWLVLRARGAGGAMRMLGTLAALMLSAGFDELTQPFFHRSAEWGDWNMDCLGATVAILVCELLLKLRRRKAAS